MEQAARDGRMLILEEKPNNWRATTVPFGELRALVGVGLSTGWLADRDT